MRPRFSLLVALVLIGGTACAEPPVPLPDGPPSSELEAEVARLRGDVAHLERLVETIESTSSSGPNAVPECSPTEELATTNGPLLVEEGGWLKRFAVEKGDYRVVPYGIGWLTMAYDTSRTFTGPFVLYVQSPDVQGEESFTISARATRFGFDVFGPDVLCWTSRGRFEFDAFGSATVENQSTLRMRQAYGEFRRGDWRAVGGQTDDVISPLRPQTVNFTVGWNGGNIGFRRPQLRIEHRHDDDGLRQTAQFSINRTIAKDFADDPTFAGEDAGWPTIMGRYGVAVDDWSLENRPFEIGVSAHIGQESFDIVVPPARDDLVFTSWSLNLDVEAPLTERCGVRGELFWGSVLGTFLGGVNQEIDPIRRTGIRSRGGWVEGWVRLSNVHHTHFGYGVDDPFGNLSVGRRSRNDFWFGNVIWNVTPLFSVGLEVSYWRTDYVGLADGDAVRIETAMKFRF